MTAHYPVPIQEDVRDLLVDLLGRGVAADKVSPLELDDETPAAIAEFVDDDDRTACACIVDDRFAVRVGAALVMVPSNVAEEDLATGELPDNHLENVREVVNIFGRMLNSASTPHVRLAELHRWPGELPPGVVQLLEAPEYRRDFAVAVEGYGEGRFSLLVN
ncbi:MAG: hypothetical protein M3Z03_14145 [Actinomycetota bacterium]|nr:hypothetical protein [Actinomycetota bacterium]